MAGKILKVERPRVTYCRPPDSGNPGELGFTTISQRTMDYLVFDGPGRQDFVRFWRLMAEAVQDHPSAFAMEWMNEPMTIRRTQARCCHFSVVTGQVLTFYDSCHDSIEILTDTGHDSFVRIRVIIATH